MKIIDRYLMGQFLHVFVICFLSLTGLYVVFDAFSHLDDFQHPLRRKERATLLRVIGEFYFFCFSIAFFERLSGVTLP